MVWTAPEVERPFRVIEVPTGDERALADRWLDHHRQTLLWKCGGLTAEQLMTRAAEPSELTLLGLVRHMAENERDWFRTRFAGEKVEYLYVTDDDINAEFRVDGADAEADYSTYVRELEVIRELLADRSLDEVYLDPRRQIEMNLRWVYHAMIQEYARHNGHADLLRERIDGSTGH
jgi:hypothetical protein